MRATALGRGLGERAVMKRLFIVSVSLFLLAGCTKSFDVFFANPCDHRITITTYSVPPDQVSSEPKSANAAIPSLTVKKMEDAFFNTSGYSWSVVVNGVSKPVVVDGKRLINDTVMLPSGDAC